MRLPAELRLQIYGYLFPARRVEVLRLIPQKPANPKRKGYRLYHRQLQPRDPVTQSTPRCAAAGPAGFGCLTPFPLALVFSCKDIYHDALCSLYSHTQFVFNSAKSVARFLKLTPPAAQAAVRHVELNYQMYNEPRLVAFRVFKHRCDLAWYSVCKAVADSFTSLHTLHVRMNVRDWPIRLALDERWALPLMAFARKNLLYADVNLAMVMFSQERLHDTARRIEQAIMHPAAYQAKEASRIAIDIMAHTKALKSLRLIF